jgi:hypothetical protein
MTQTQTPNTRDLTNTPTTGTARHTHLEPRHAHTRPDSDMLEISTHTCTRTDSGGKTHTTLHTHTHTHTHAHTRGPNTQPDSHRKRKSKRHTETHRNVCAQATHTGTHRDRHTSCSQETRHIPTYADTCRHPQIFLETHTYVLVNTDPVAQTECEDTAHILTVTQGATLTQHTDAQSLAHTQFCSRIPS